MPLNDTQLPLGAYYTETGAISIRRGPKDKQIEHLLHKIQELESRISFLENGYSELNRKA